MTEFFFVRPKMSRMCLFCSVPRQFGQQEDTRQDLEHCLPRPEEEPRLLKPHVVLAAEQGPHWARMALKRSDPAFDEFLNHHWRSYAAIFQQPQPEPDVGKAGAREPLMAPAGVGNSGPRRSLEQRTEHAGTDEHPSCPEFARGWRKLEVDPRASRRSHSMETQATRALLGVNQMQ